MYSLKRLTGAVLSRSALRPQAAAAPALAANRSVGSMSGKETSYSSEPHTGPQQAFQKDRKTAKQAQQDSNKNGNNVHPYANHEDPKVLRPDGSNSEEAVAADRSDVDPLAVKKKGGAKKGAMETPDNMHSSTDRSGRPSKTPLRQVANSPDLVTGGPAAGP